MVRRRRKKASGGRSKRILVRVLLVVGLLLAVSAVGGYLRLRAYLHSEGFRSFLAGLVGRTLHSEVVLEPFRWDGLQVNCGGMTADGTELVREVRANGLRTEVGLGGVSNGVWKLRGAVVRRVDLVLGRGELPVLGSSSLGEGWLPRRVELEDLRIEEANLSGRVGEDEFAARGQSWVVMPGVVSGAYDFAARGGSIDHPWSWFPDPELVQARFRVQGKRLYLTDAEAKVYGEGRLHMTGEAGFDEDDYTFEGSVRGVRGDRVLPEDWAKRLSGDLGADFTISYRDGRLGTRGKIGMKDAVLTALPVLDRLAAYADTTRFRVLNLNVARLDFFAEGERLRLTDIRIGSEGLLRLEGRMDIIGEQMDGRFALGLAPGTLARIPGAESKVFAERRDGLMWAPLRITGTMDDPQEDLSERLILAAGERMFELLPETGTRVLKFTRSAISDGASEMISGAPGVVGAGVDVIQGAGGIVRDVGGGLFGLLPGRAKQDEEQKPAGEKARDLVEDLDQVQEKATEEGEKKGLGEGEKVGGEE